MERSMYEYTRCDPTMDASLDQLWDAIQERQAYNRGLESDLAWIQHEQRMALGDTEYDRIFTNG